MSQLMTHAQLSQMIPLVGVDVVDAWHPPLVKHYAANHIDTDAREAAQMASGINETGGYRVFFEASYYTTPWLRIAQIFGGVLGLTAELVESWKALGRAGFDVAFFNHVYADANRPPGYRLGNTQPGDGWKYRGMGPGAITGRGNYAWLQNILGIDLLSNPEIIATPDIGALIMATFWTRNGLNAAVDDGSEAGFLYAMRRLNAGLSDFSAHLSFWHRNVAIMANDEIPELLHFPLMPTVKKAAAWDMQERLCGKGWDTNGIDGIVGPGTSKAIAGFEGAAGLTKDGLVDDDMLAALRMPFLGLHRGAKDKQAVGEFQRALMKAGVNLDPYRDDGDFGGATEGGLIAFQKRRNLKPSGFADKATLADLQLAA